MVVQAYEKTGRGFTFPGYSAKYPREPNYMIKHYKLEIWIYFNEKRLEGISTIDVYSLYKTDYIILDAIDHNIKKVYIDDKPAEYDYDGKILTIYFKRKLGKKVKRVKIEYSVKRPRYGIYFVDGEPEMIYTQGETEWNRFWMPIYDYPNMKFTTETIIHVPRDWKAFSNGVLVKKWDEGKWSIWHYKFDFPHSSYLIALAAGRLSIVNDSVDNIKLEYVVPEGKEDLIKTTFLNTPGMIKFYSEWIGLKYPYPVYRQVVVREFIVGGMENTSITILTDRSLLDKHARKDVWSEGLISHELSHQWFGDLVTCRDWSQIWLNESFATFMADLYFRHWRGLDDFIYGLYNDLRSYLGEYEEWYSRPIVYRVYEYGEEMFDRHSYPKGAVILNMLMNIVGEEIFRKAVKDYLLNHKFSNVETDDFRKSLEKYYGRPLEWFFDQFIYNSGHPILKVKYRYESDKGLLRITIEQAQKDDSPETYRIPVEISIIYRDGKEEKRSVLIEEKIEHITIKCKKRPNQIYIDPMFKVFAVIEPEYPVEDLIRILLEGKYTYWKLLAIKRLSKEPSTKVIDALYKAVIESKFYGVGREAAKALGDIRTEYAKNRLLEALDKVNNPRVKSAILEALANYKDEVIGEKAVKYLSNKEEAYTVRALAAYAIGKSKYSKAVEIIKKYIDEPSYADVIRIYCLRGLGEYGGDEAFKIINKYTSKEYTQIIRMTALEQLGNFPDKKKEVLEILSKYVYEDNRFIRMGIINAVKKLMIPESIKILDIIIDREKMGFVWKPAKLVKRKLTEAMEKGIEYKKLREELEKIREETRRIGERIEALEHKGI